MGPILIVLRFHYHSPGQIIATSAEVNLNGGLVREFSQNAVNSGLGFIVICPDSQKVIGWIPKGNERQPHTHTQNDGCPRKHGFKPIRLVANHHA